MKILYLSSVLPKRSETFVYKEALGLRKAGVDVEVASLYEPEHALGDPLCDALGAAAVTVYPGGMGKLVADALLFAIAHPGRSAGVVALAFGDMLTASDIGLAARLKLAIQAIAGLALARRVAGFGITAIHVHMAHAASTVGMYAARALGVPFSFTGHAADLFRERCLLKQKLRRAVFVACISEWHKNWYRTMVPGTDAKYPVVRCGVDIPPRIAPVRMDGRFRLLGLARLVPKKGFDVLIEAAAILQKKGIPVDCTIAGDGPERARLEALADSLGIPVRFTGNVSNSEVPEMLSAVDAMVLPCRIGDDGDRDGIPVAFMEAMASGVCAVSGDLPTIRELIQDGVTGLLIPPGDSAALAKALERLATDKEFRLTLARAGRRRVEEEFSSVKNIARIRASLQLHARS